MFGGETLQELRIAFNLAEGEREGGYSATTSPMMSLTDIGNIFSKSNFNLPTIDKSKILMEFPTMFHLMEYLKINGDQNCVAVKRDSKSPETFLAAASIYQTLFNKMTIPIDELTMNFDELSNNLDFFCNNEEDKHFLTSSDPIVQQNIKQFQNGRINILSTFEVIFLVGWKYHESQQKKLKPKTESFSMKDVMQEIELKEGKGTVRYGTISEDMKFEDVDKIKIK